MKITNRFTFLAVATATMLLACGGAADDPELTAGGQSALDGKKGDPNTGTKPPPDDGTKKPGDPNDPGAGTGGSCFWSSEGSESSCKDESTWKQYASDACGAKGTTLTDLTFGDSCSGGYRYAKFECCFADPKDPGPVPPKEPDSCTYHYANDACQSEPAWKDQALQTCQKAGLSLIDISYGATCGKNGDFSETKFVCCK